MMRLDDRAGALRSYGFNVRAGDGDTSRPDPVAAIRSPEKVAMIADNRGSNALGLTTITARHRGFCNVVYFDGHVGSIKLTDTIKKNYKTRFWGQNQYADQW